MKDPNRKELEAESNLYSKIDNEGGFVEAFFSYGIDIDDYPIRKEMAKEIQDIKDEMEPLVERMQAVMEELEMSQEDYFDDNGYDENDEEDEEEDEE